MPGRSSAGRRAPSTGSRAPSKSSLSTRACPALGGVPDVEPDDDDGRRVPGEGAIGFRLLGGNGVHADIDRFEGEARVIFSHSSHPRIVHQAYHVLTRPPPGPPGGPPRRKSSSQEP